MSPTLRSSPAQRGGWLRPHCYILTASPSLRSSPAIALRGRAAAAASRRRTFATASSWHSRLSALPTVLVSSRLGSNTALRLGRPGLSCCSWLLDRPGGGDALRALLLATPGRTYVRGSLVGASSAAAFPQGNSCPGTDSDTNLARIGLPTAIRQLSRHRCLPGDASGRRSCSGARLSCRVLDRTATLGLRLHPGVRGLVSP